MTQFQGAQPVVLVREVNAPDGLAAPQRGEVLDEGVIGAGVAPAFDTPDMAAEFATPGSLVGPDVAVAGDAKGAHVSLAGTDIERGSAIDGLLKGGSYASEFEDVVTPLGTDGGFAMAGGDAADNVFDEGAVASGIGRRGEGRRGGGSTGDGRDVEGVLLLKVDEAVCNGCRVNAGGDFHAAGRDIAEEVPPFRVVGECGISDTSDEAGDFEEVLDLGKVGVWEGVACEAPEDATGDKVACAKHSFCNFARRSIVAEENDPFLG